MGRSRTTITKESTASMPPRGKSRRTLMLKAIQEVMGLDKLSKSEPEYYQFCIAVAMGLHEYKNDEGEQESTRPDPQMMREVLSRLFPATKQTFPIYEFDMPSGESSTKLEKADSVIAAISSGKLPIDAGKALMDIIKDASSIEEIEQMSKRIEALEKLYEQSISKED